MCGKVTSKGNLATMISQASITERRILPMLVFSQKPMGSTDLCGTTFPCLNSPQRMESQLGHFTLYVKFRSGPGNLLLAYFYQYAFEPTFLMIRIRKKFKLATQEALNPIKQDDSSGYLASFKKGDIYFNHGCFPRCSPPFPASALSLCVISLHAGRGKTQITCIRRCAASSTAPDDHCATSRARNPRSSRPPSRLIA